METDGQPCRGKGVYDQVTVLQAISDDQITPTAGTGGRRRCEEVLPTAAKAHPKTWIQEPRVTPRAKLV